MTAALGVEQAPLREELHVRREESSVTAHTTFTLRDGVHRLTHRRRGGMGSLLRVRMQYLTSDPYAVHVRFSSGNAADVEWVFARRLLAEGLHQQSGQGDVRIAPLPGSKGAVIAIELSAPAGRAFCEASAGELAAFIDASERLVPIGGEPQVIDLDTELAALLTAGGA